MSGVALYRPEIDGGPEPPMAEFQQIIDDFWIIEGHGIPWEACLPHLERLFCTGSAAELVLAFVRWRPFNHARREGLKQIKGVRLFPN